jgi:hypothetical protein
VSITTPLSLLSAFGFKGLNSTRHSSIFFCLSLFSYSFLLISLHCLLCTGIYFPFLPSAVTNGAMPLCSARQSRRIPTRQGRNIAAKFHPFKTIPEGTPYNICPILNQTLSKEQEKLLDAVPKRLAHCDHVNWFRVLDQ